MNKLKFLLQIVFVLAVSLVIFQNAEAQSRVDRILINEAERITGDDFPVYAETPKGVRVFAVNQPNSKMLNAIDQGFTDLTIKPLTTAQAADIRFYSDN